MALMKFVTVVVFPGRHGVRGRCGVRSRRDACGISLCRWPRMIGLVRTVWRGLDREMILASVVLEETWVRQQRRDVTEE